MSGGGSTHNVASQHRVIVHSEVMARLPGLCVAAISARPEHVHARAVALVLRLTVLETNRFFGRRTRLSISS
jgi:hypothetical protein